MHGIAGYEPALTDSVDQVLARHGPLLLGLVGQRLASVTGLCFVVDDDWCSTMPLVLDFGGPRLELVFDGFNQMFLSWDTIDVGAPIDTPDQDDPDLALAWGDPHRAGLTDVLGSAVRQVRVLEHDSWFRPVGGPAVQAWLLAGLEFVFDESAALQLTNIYSELRVTTEPPDGEGWRRWEVPRR